MGRVMGKFGLPSFTRKSPRTIIKRLWIFFKGGGTSLQLVFRLRSFVWYKKNDRTDRYFLDSLKSNPYKRIVKIRRRGRWSLENLWGRKEKEEGREEMFDKTCPVVDFPDFRLFFLGKNLSVSGEAERFLWAWFIAPLRREDTRHSPRGVVEARIRTCAEITRDKGKIYRVSNLCPPPPSSTRFSAISRVILRE